MVGGERRSSKIINRYKTGEGRGRKGTGKKDRWARKVGGKDIRDEGAGKGRKDTGKTD